jgi:hypothetical protein
MTVLPTVYLQHSVRRTRNESRCCECRNVIPVGSACKVGTGIWDGRPDRFRWCLICDLLKREVESLLDDWHEPIRFGGLFDAIDAFGSMP